MASVIKAGNATDGVQVTSDNTGILELKTGTGSGTTAMTVGTGQNVTFAQAANLPNTFGFKNRIINGGMVIDQRNNGASVSVGVGATAYPVDRFFVDNGTDGAYTVQRVAEAPAEFTNSLKVTVTTADASLGAAQFSNCIQAIEGFNIADLAWGTANAKPVTLSFWVRSSLTGTFGGSLRGASSTRSYPFTYAISAANTWEQKTIVIVGETSGTWLVDNSIGVQVMFGLGVGSNFLGTAGAWENASRRSATGATNIISTLNATWQITGVQLEKGSTATSFDYRPYGTELALCQRYCQVISGAGVSNNYQRIGYGPGTSTSGGLTQVQLKATMRIAPTLTATAANTFTVFDGVTLTALTSLAIDAANSQNLAYVVWSVAGTPLTATRAYELLFNNTASGSFALSAEL